MSTSAATHALASARRDLERHRKTQADEEAKAVRFEGEAVAKERSAASTSMESSRRSYLSSAQSKRSDALKARERAARASSDVAKAQVKVHGAETKLRDEERKAEKQAADKAKSAADRADRERRQAEERAKRDADRAAREQKRRDSATEHAQRSRERASELEISSLRQQVAEHGRVIQAAPWDAAPETITVLFIAASPEDQHPLRIDREMREIQQRVRASEHRDSISFEFSVAAQVADLLQRLNEVKPDVVHFSGHGAEEGLVFEDADGDSRLLDNSDLASLLRISSNRIRLAVFNSCNSSAAAAGACLHLDAAIGMDETIDDDAAKTFAGQFYNSLGFGLPLSKAFEQALFQMQVVAGNNSGAPRLHVADGVDPADVFIVKPTGNAVVN